MPILEKAKTIASLELKGCSTEIAENLLQKIDAIKSSYEVLVEQKNDNHISLIMKNKDTSSFTELIIFDQSKNTFTNLVKLTGSFDISDIIPPKEYNE